MQLNPLLSSMRTSNATPMMLATDSNKTKEEKVQSPLSISSEQLLRHYPQNTIRLSEAALLLNDRFKNQNVLWIHGTDHAAQEIALKAYKDSSVLEYRGNIHQINAGESGIELLTAWESLGIQLHPTWKNCLPEDFSTAFEEAWNDKPYLIIMTNVKISHISILVSILQQVKVKNHHYLIFSDQQLNEESLSIRIDRAWMRDKCQNEQEVNQLEARLQDIFSLSLLLTWLKRNHFSLEEFLQQWGDKKISLENVLNLLKDEEPKLYEAFRTLSHLENAPIKKDFIERIFSKESVVLLQEYQIFTSVENELITSLPDIFKAIRPEGYDSFIEHIRSYVDLPFRDPSKAWVIPHVRKIFALTKVDDPKIFVALASLMLDIGHYYTQHDNPVLAQEVTYSIRKALEEFVQRKNKKNLSSDPQKCIEEMWGIHPFLSFIYIQSQYQIGRTYFYLQVPREKMGSIAVLKHAEKLCESLEKKLGKKLLLSVLIQRNGLLFHQMEDKQEPTHVIEKYLSFLETRETYYEVNYKTGKLEELNLDGDFSHQTTCLRYLIQIKLSQKKSIEEEVSRFKAIASKISPEKKLTVLVLLSQALLNQGKPQEALNELSNLELGNLLINQKITFLKSQDAVFMPIKKGRRITNGCS